MTGKRIVLCAVALAVFALVATAFVPATAGAEEWTAVVQRIGDTGRVNWSEGYIESTGIGVPPERFYGKPQARPMALRAARLDAYRNLLEVTKGVYVTSQSTVRDFVTESDVIRAQVEGMIKGAQVVNREYLSDGTVEVTVRMALNGGFAAVILPQDIQPMPEVQQKQPPSAPAPPPVPATPEQAPAPSHDTTFTGLVIDARSLGARPAMSPRLVDEDGKEVYGSAYVSREYAVQQGMSGYSKDLGAAQTNPRVTNNPLTVKAVRTEGPGRADLVISRADAERIRGASDNLSFLRKCRVMIVLD